MSTTYFRTYWRLDIHQSSKHFRDAPYSKYSFSLNRNRTAKYIHIILTTNIIMKKLLLFVWIALTLCNAEIGEKIERRVVKINRRTVRIQNQRLVDEPFIIRKERTTWENVSNTIKVRT